MNSIKHVLTKHPNSNPLCFCLSLCLHVSLPVILSVCPFLCSPFSSLYFVTVQGNCLLFGDCRTYGQDLMLGMQGDRDHRTTSEAWCITTWLYTKNKIRNCKSSQLKERRHSCLYCRSGFRELLFISLAFFLSSGDILLDQELCVK